MLDFSDRMVISYQTAHPEADYKEIAGAYPSYGIERIQEILTTYGPDTGFDRDSENL